MAGYGPPKMSRTPWGRAGGLRERRLSPGPGSTPEQVERSQRERLYAATVATVAEKGYEATTVGDLLALSGVSRSAFYRHFRDKEDCLLETFEAIVELSRERVSRELEAKRPWKERGRAALAAVLGEIASQPAAARLCFCEVGTAGPRAAETSARATANFVALAQETFAGLRGDGGLPSEMVRALLYGGHTIARSRLHTGEADALPDLASELWDWATGYEPPPVPLRLSGRRPRHRNPNHGMPPLAAYSQGERLIRALAATCAERGYAEATIAEVAARAGVSPATFNAHFAGKEEAVVAAFDSTIAQMLAVALPATRRAPDWPNAMRAGIGAMLAFGAAEPDLAWLAAAGTYVVSPRAVALRERSIEGLRRLLKPGYGIRPEAPAIAAEAIAGAVLGIACERIVFGGPESLPEAAPLATYVALSPFLGAAAAAEVANGDGLGR